MADITFTGTLVTNPGLEDVLDPDGTITEATASDFAIANATGGTWDGYVFHFSSSGFSYDVGSNPTAGTIGSVTAYQPDGATVVATITGTLNTSLASVWNELQSDGVFDALDQLLNNTDTYNGGAGDDVLTQFGSSAGDTLLGGGGNDIVTGRRNATLVGDGGDDTLVVGTTGGSTYHFTIAGSAQDGSGGAGETNTLVLADFAYIDAITDIDALEFAAQAYGYFEVTDVGAGLLSDTVAVRGSSTGANQIVLQQDATQGMSIDLSGWTFEDWERSDQQVRIEIYNSTFADTVLGSIAADVVITTGGDDTLDGGGGDDYLDGGAGSDILRGGLGNDFISADADDTEIDGGEDTDVLSLDLIALTQAIVVDPTLGTGVLADTTVVFTGIEGLSYFRSGAGDDIIDAGEGGGSVYSGAGNDILDGGVGNDQLYGEGGDDQLFSRLGEGGSELLDGGEGVDFAFVDRSDKSRSLTLDLADPSLSTAIGDGTGIVRVERIEFRSGSGNDSLTGGDLGDTILGNGGRDLISGRGDNDTLSGGDGLDIIDGGDGDDDIDGGDGIDFLSGDAGNDTLNGGVGADLLDGGAGNDVLAGGTNGDNLGGGAGNDTLNGDAGADIVDGGSGNDTIGGGSGRDTIDGESDDDVINGGRGRDSLTGGGGNDAFVFADALKRSNVDTIEDFVVADDTIVLDNAIFTKLNAGKLKGSAFEVGSKADDKKDRIVYDKRSGDLFYDANGKKAGMQQKIAELDDGLNLKAGDFLII